MNIHGLMEEYTKALGKKTNLMEKVSTIGLMEGGMTENTKMIKNTDLVHTTGLTVKHTKVCG